MTSEHWRIAWRPKRLELTFAGDFSGFRLIEQPLDRAWADPFAFERGSRRFIFFEELIHGVGRGTIACLELDSEGGCSRSQVVINDGHHLSYPFIFEHAGDVFLLPESSATRKIQSYRAVEFPHKWEPHRVLMEGVSARDSTLLHHSNKYWLFASGISAGSQNSQCYLFMSDKPWGPWTPHPKSPLIDDVHRARPAGPVFMHEGELYRPGQNCSNDYGAGVWLNRIEVIDENDYHEVPVRYLDARVFNGASGLHTISNSQTIEVIDVRWDVLRVSGLWSAAKAS